jgi:hypothetical protein
MENLNKEYLKIQNQIQEEKTVRTLGDIILSLGLIISVSLLILAGFARIHYGEPYNWILIFVAVYSSLMSFTVWGVLRMLSNISTTLKTKN